MKKSNTPRRKRLKKNVRLLHGAKWIKENSTFKNIVRSYAKWFGVSRLCAAQELIQLGIAFDSDVIAKEKLLETERIAQRKIAKEKRLAKITGTGEYNWYCEFDRYYTDSENDEVGFEMNQELPF